jgi:recombination protein RecA
MSTKDKWKVVSTAMSSIQKALGRGAIMKLGDRPVEVVPSIPTGSPSLDAAIGTGGYPRGRVVEVYGPESSGKTTLALHAIAECQRQDGIAAFIDAEHALDVQYAGALGVRLEELVFSQPDSGEQALDILEVLVRSGGVDLVVVDSVAALVPQAELDGEMGDQQVGLQARLMSKALRKLTGVAQRSGTTVLFINQLRQKIGVSFGNPETTTGGRAMHYYASVRLDVRRIGALKSGETLLGNRTRVKVAKNKVAPPFKRAEFDIRWGEGIDVAGEVLDRAVERDLVHKSGAHYSLGDRRLGQGREAARAALLADEALRAELTAAVFGVGPTSTGEPVKADRAA